MLSAHVSAAHIDCLDLDFSLATNRFDLLVRVLKVFEFHSLHIDNHGIAIDSP